MGEEGPGKDLTGKIALLHQEDLAVNNPVTLQSLLERVNTAAAAGASAAVITGNITGMEQFAPLFGAQVPIPALILPQPQIGAQLYAMAQSSEVTLSVNIETQVLESQNVVAELEGTRRRAGHCRRTLRRRSANGGRGQRQHLRHRRRLGVGRSTGQ